VISILYEGKGIHMAPHSPATPSTGPDKLALIRAELPAVQSTVYLNTGTNGPLPRRGVAALTQQARLELEEGRIAPGTWPRFQATMVETRQAFAALLRCAPDEVALTHNTTEGMNIALMGLNWQPGDELVTASSEHGGALNPIALIKQRFGVRVHYTPIGLRDHDPVEELAKVLSPRTKALVLSHVSWSTGTTLPIQQLSELAHSAGALVVCDAAQSCGMLPTDVSALGVDAYACSGQKWLCGPDGTGALFVRRESLDRIQQTYIGFAGVKSQSDNPTATFEPGDGAQRYEAGAFYPPALMALNASLAWIAEDVGWEWAYRRIHELGRYCYAELERIEGVELYLPEQAITGLIHFKLTGVSPETLTLRLAEEGIMIRHTPEPPLNRVSTGFYTSDEDIDQLARAISAQRNVRTCEHDPG
jgi:L-cysteine/cystine lyase